MTPKPDSVPAHAGTDPSEILAFLDTAPEPVKDWAKKQSQLVRQEQIKQLQAEKKKTDAEDPADENELALAELDEVEDETPLFKKRAMKKAAKAAEAQPATDSGGTSDRKVILISLAIALVVGISSGAYFSNQSNNDAVAAEQMQMPMGHPDISDMDNNVPVASLAELEARLMTDPEDAEALIQLGALRFDNGEIDVAEEHWLEVLDIDPDAAEAYYNLGFAYMASEPARMDEAAEAWDTVLELVPGTDLAVNAERHKIAITNGDMAPAEDGAEPTEDDTVTVEVDEEDDVP